MSQDWIKMRTWLAKDPKVIAMASELASDLSFMQWLTFGVRKDCKQTAYEHVEQKVIVSIVVAGLLQVWGTVRIDGKRPSELGINVPMSHGTNLGTCPVNVLGHSWDMSQDDLILTHSTLQTIDDICGVDGFGEAMREVGWVSEVEGPHFALVFHKFFLRNHDTTELKRESERIRKQQYREKMSQCPTGHLRDMSHQNVPPEKRREEKRREEKKEEKSASPPLSANADQSLPILTSENGHLGPTAEQLIVAWNSAPVVGCARIAGKRRTVLTARNRDPYFREHWRTAIAHVADCPFLCGGNDRGWVADIDWFLRPDTVLKIMEGKYDAREVTKRGTSYVELFGDVK